MTSIFLTPIHKFTPLRKGLYLIIFFMKAFLCLWIFYLILGCSGSVERSIKALDSPDWRIRQKAVNHLLESKDKRSIDPLIHKGLKDDDFYVRRSSVQALGKLKDKRAVGPLIEVFKKDLTVREEAALAIGQIGDNEAVQFLKDLVESDDYIERGYGIGGLAQLEKKEFFPLFYKSAKDRFYFVRERAVEGLRRIEGKKTKSIDIYARLLNDKNPEIRGYAVEDIARLGNRNLYKYINEGLKDNDPFVRKRAVLAAGMLSDERTVDSLVELLNRDPSLKKNIIKSLQKTGSKKVFNLFIKFLEDKDVEVRKASINALGEFEDRRIIDPLISLFERDTQTRKDVVLALGNIKDEKAFEFLKGVATNREMGADIRAYAVEAMGMHKNRKAIVLLKNIYKGGEPKVRIEAAKALANLEDEEIISILEELLSTEKDEEVSMATKEALNALQKKIGSLKREEEKKEERKEQLR